MRQTVPGVVTGKPLAIGVDLIFDTPSLRGAQDDDMLGAAVAVVIRALDKHRRRPRVRLDVVGLITEPFQADEVVECLPDNPSHWNLGHHAE